MNNANPLGTVLVPLDGSETGERAVPWAKAVAGTNTRIVLMEVTPLASTVRSLSGQVIGTAETIQEGYRQIADQQLTAARDRWFGANDSISTVVAIGDPSEQILATAKQTGADLIVMSSHGRGAVGRFVSGSVADRVVRSAPVPVMIVGPEGDLAKDATIERIIAPIEDSGLSLAAIPVAARISESTKTPIVVVHVVRSAGELAFVPYPVAVDLSPAAVFEQAVADAKALVDRFVTRLHDEGIEASGEVSDGNAVDSIIEILQPGDVIVLSSHARQGLARWVLGSTAMKLLRNGRAPVIVVTSESMEKASPVT